MGEIYTTLVGVMIRFKFLWALLAISHSLAADEGEVQKEVRKTHYPTGAVQSVQTHVSSPNQESVAHGDYTEFFSNGSIRAQGTVIFGKRHGRWLFVDETGRRTQGEYQNGLRSGHWTQWSLTREIRVDEQYVNDRLHGPRIAFFENNKKASEEFYVNGLRQGHTKSWYPNGANASEEEWMNGKRHGLYKRWDEYGVLLTSGNYTMNTPTGVWEWRNLKDQVLKREELGNGTGTFYQFVVSGEKQGDRRVVPRKETTLRQGKIDGAQKTYFPDGLLQARLLFQRGNRHGSFVEWAPNGRVLREGEYKNDEMVKTTEYYPNEDVNAPQVVSKELHRVGAVNVEVKEYNRAGAISSDFALENGKPNGLFVTYHPDGKLMREGHFEAGLRSGLWKEYYPDGQLHSSQQYIRGKESGSAEKWFLAENDQKPQKATAGQFVNGKKDGQWTAWYPDGGLRVVKQFRYGLENGDYKELWPRTPDSDVQQVRSEGRYILGEREGEWSIMYANGNLKSRASYRNGKEHGVAEEFYDIKKGKKQLVRLKGEFIDGAQHGKWVAYFADGEPQLEQTYKLGKLHGTTKQYYDTHVLKNEIYYENGLQEGKAVTYYPNKKSKSRASYAEGLLHGEFITYHEDGKMANKGSYHRGIAVGTWKWFDKSGRTILASSEFDKGTGTMYQFHEGSQKKRETSYVKGVKSGSETIWYESGAKKADSAWYQGMLHGTYREWHESGQLQVESQYENGRLQGPYAAWYGNKQERLKLMYHQDTLSGISEEWYENGTVKTKGLWRSGVRQGLWTWFDRYGDELFRIEYDNGVVIRSTQPDTEQRAKA